VKANKQKGLLKSRKGITRSWKDARHGVRSTIDMGKRRFDSHDQYMIYS
jgi:hypothetical protein